MIRKILLIAFVVVVIGGLSTYLWMGVIRKIARPMAEEEAIRIVRTMVKREALTNPDWDK